TDPDGTPLHECAWGKDAAGRARLLRARMQLDWGQWIGLKPEGLVNATQLDLSRKPGWQRLRADDLRQMAAQAMQVPFEEVQFFYGDDDLQIDAQGCATIRHKKDAFYVLDDGTFERARFMACMGAMHWHGIDFLPVVELFQSLLPGTGSAVFELIRGLYDDQNDGRSQPPALRYRGIPTYPSEAAYRLFSAFFTPCLPRGGDPFPIFMDQSRSHEVLWLPAPDPPRRCFDQAHRLCVTIKGSSIQKATKADDPSGLPFVSTGPNGFAPCERRVTVGGGALLLQQGQGTVRIPLNPSWGPIKDTVPPPQEGAGTGEGWRSLFGGQLPPVEPAQAFSAVLIYPDDDREIGELESQPFVADYLQDLSEQVPELSSRVGRSTHVLVDGFDATITTCLRPDGARHHTVLYDHAAFAQKQAQLLWNQLAQTNHLDWLPSFRFLPAAGHRESAYKHLYDLLFIWTPFQDFARPEALQRTCRRIPAALRPGGLVFVVGPTALPSHLTSSGLTILQRTPVEQLPTVAMHRTILPKAGLKPGVILYLLTRR
ncbi:MAG: hypothetical protein KGJ14_07510, partial [Nitrospirota bacterium]|nr:hypothetical protein [Nitrospirota bacterium]